jgi:hypothetical protein
MVEENRARFKNDSRNVPSPRSASGPVAEPAVFGAPAVHDWNSVPANEMGPGILNSNSVPMTKDSHAGGRHSGLQNLSVKPGEKSRAAYTDEIHRRIHGRDVKYR